MFFSNFEHPIPNPVSLLLLAGWLALSCALVGGDTGDGPAETLENPPKGPFGYSLIATEGGESLEEGSFESVEGCTDCHERQGEEFEGSLHRIAHTDLLYRATAELARKEAGEEVYLYCAGCHSPQGVTMDMVRGTPDDELPGIAKEGILCDVCHQISELTGAAGPWEEPGNASFVLSPDEERKFGPPGGDDEASDHLVETREFLASSEFCASCHTIIHPLNGLRLEHTYQEWKESVYAERGIQCQDCHMRSVQAAVKVAETLVPVTVIGLSEPNGQDREIYPHFFAGANANADLLGGSPEHAAMAEARLKSAARLEIEAPPSARAGKKLAFEVLVRNVAAGHNLPTSLIELREMWVELKVLTPGGELLFHSGGLEENGDIPSGAMRFGAIAGDAQGRVTHKPWEVTQFLFKRLIRPKGSESDRFRVPIPEGVSGRIRIEARLFYRSAAPEVVRSLLGDEAFELRQVEMASQQIEVAVD